MDAPNQSMEATYNRAVRSGHRPFGLLIIVIAQGAGSVPHLTSEGIRQENC